MNEQENRNLTHDTEEVIDLRELFFKMLFHWPWFMIAVPLCVAAAFYVYLVWTPVYQVEAKVMISDSKKGELGQNVMMKELGFLQGGDVFVENEMVELESKNLMREVVKELDLNVSYAEENFPRDKNLYTTSPIRVLVDQPEHIRDTSFTVVVDRIGRVTLLQEDGKVVFKGKYSQAIPMEGYQMTIENMDTTYQEHRVLVHLYSFETATDAFRTNMTVKLIGKNTNAVGLSIKDVIPQRGIDVLNALVNRYNDNGVKDKQLVSTKTVEFINERLKVINSELGTIENDAERFKKENRLTDITSDAALVMEKKKTADAELLKLETELAVVQSIRAFLEQNGPNEFRLLPENLGLTDETLASGITQYNEMVLRRSKLMMTANESNPLVINLSNQLKDLKSNIRIAIVNVEKSQRIKINSLKKENLSVNEMITSVPTQEKQYRAIARQQELRENLFLFLMQKREEAEIAKLMYVPAAKIIEDARSGKYPVAPRKMLILLAGVIAGLAIPFMLILLKEMMNTKVRSVEEVEKVIKSPVLGSIPSLPQGKTDIFQENFIVSESMQLIREKLNYIIQPTTCPIIMVTSTIPSEGKSLVSTHLAYAYAKAGKKVIVLGCDLRNPKLNTFFKKQSHKGLSAYLAGLTDDPEELIDHITDHLDAMFGGVIPPNPTQLIAGQRMEELLTRLKGQYDCILLDTPPLGILADGFSLSKFIDACVYVIRANVLDKNALRGVISLEYENRVKNLSILVNDIKITHTRYGYGYGYGEYGKKSKKKKSS